MHLSMAQRQQYIQEKILPSLHSVSQPELKAEFYGHQLTLAEKQQWLSSYLDYLHYEVADEQLKHLADKPRHLQHHFAHFYKRGVQACIDEELPPVYIDPEHSHEILQATPWLQGPYESTPCVPQLTQDKLSPTSYVGFGVLGASVLVFLGLPIFAVCYLGAVTLCKKTSDAWTEYRATKHEPLNNDFHEMTEESEPEPEATDAQGLVSIELRAVSPTPEADDGVVVSVTSTNVEVA